MEELKLPTEAVALVATLARVDDNDGELGIGEMRCRGAREAESLWRCRDWRDAWDCKVEAPIEDSIGRMGKDCMK